MKSITVRNIPDEILKAVRLISIKERRSLNNELIVIIPTSNPLNWKTG
jgi:plasmid stability protein